MLVGFCHTSTWISHRYAYAPLPPTSHPIPPFLVATEHQIWAPYVIQQISTGCLIWHNMSILYVSMLCFDIICQYICFNVMFSICPTLSFPPTLVVWHPFYVESKKKWYKWIYLQNRKRLTDKEWTYGCWGEGIVREFGTDMCTLLCLKWSVAQGNCCYVVAWMGEGLGENGSMYVYGWILSQFTWNYHNIVNWLYPSIK